MLYLTNSPSDKTNNAKKYWRSVDVKVSQTQIHRVKQMAQNGVNYLSNLGSRLIPAVTKVVSKVILGLTTGVFNSLGNFSMDKTLCKCAQNRTINRIHKKNIPQLLKTPKLLIKSQINTINFVIHSGRAPLITLTATQHVAFLGTLLGLMEIPIS